MKINHQKEKRLKHSMLLLILDYNHNTGVFRWRVKPGKNIPVGAIAGSNAGRYCYICIEGYFYLAHRLAWFYVYKRWPKNDIDHIRGNNNRINNLREATRSQNHCNKKTVAKSKLKGAYFNPKAKRKWYSRIKTVKGDVYLGCFYTGQEAHQAYVKAAKKYHGKFARDR